MKLLFIHSDYLEYEAKEKLRFAEEVKEKKHRIEECLVVFTAVEKNDEKNPDDVVKNAVREIKDVSDTLKTNRVVIYPYAHLSSSLASPENAKSILTKMEESLKGYSVVRAPFGWYKSFKISCKGHPLSELSRIVTSEEKVTREEVVSKIKSDYYILTPDGKETRIDLENPDDEKIPEQALKKYIQAEIKPSSKEPPSIKTMQRLELVDYEIASDPGHFRFYPKGALVFNLLKKWADKTAEKLGCMEIETPILYDWAQEDIKAQTKSFHSRHYTVKTPEEKRDFILRFAGDFGLFRMMKDAKISYKSLPFRMYELTNSFRYEQRGELSGLKRLRAFHMPDIHSFTRDLEQGWDEFIALYKNYADLADDTGAEYAVVFRVVKEYYEEYKNKIVELLKYSKKPALIEVLSGKKHYWVAKHEFQGIDSVGGNVQLSTIQLDIEDAERYGIVYSDNDGKKKGCIICHSSIGSIERWIYTILENALKMEKPELPFWLAPTQVRIIPVSDEFLEDCKKITDQMNARIDIDDRDEKLGKKIRDAEMEWIPMIVVYGEKEKKSKTLPVRKRIGEMKNYSIEELKKEVEKQLKDYPYAPLPLPRMLSKRIGFRG